MLLHCWLEQVVQVARKRGIDERQINTYPLKTSFYLIRERGFRYEHKSEIEAELGFELDWRELPEKKASRILITKKVNFNNRNKLQEQFDWLIEKILKMRAAFKKYL